MRSTMSFRATREVLVRVAPRSRAARHGQRSASPDEFVAVSGSDPEYAIRLLLGPIRPPAPIRRPRAAQYGAGVQQALASAWTAASGRRGKRPVPSLPGLIPALERHGHLRLSDAARQQVPALSPATADRLLRPLRRPHGLTTTRPGRLLEQHLPVRTFTGWTDVATTWTGCLPLPHRTQHGVGHALRRRVHQGRAAGLRRDRTAHVHPRAGGQQERPVLGGAEGRRGGPATGRLRPLRRRARLPPVGRAVPRRLSGPLGVGVASAPHRPECSRSSIEWTSPARQDSPWTLAIADWTVPLFDATSSSVSDNLAPRNRATTYIGREAAGHRLGRNVPCGSGQLPLARRSCGVGTLAAAVRALFAPSPPARPGQGHVYGAWAGRTGRRGWSGRRPSLRLCSGRSSSSVSRPPRPGECTAACRNRPC